MGKFCAEILSIYIPQVDWEDQYHWLKNGNGRSMVSSVYNFLLMNDSNQKVVREDSMWKRLWKSDLLPKWKIIIWRIMHKALATKYGLRKSVMDFNTSCCFCKNQEESEAHLFRDCVVAARVWKTSQLGIISRGNQNMDVRVWIKNFLIYFWKEDGHDSPRAKLFVAVLWAIWLHRNEIVFRKANLNPASIMHSINSHNGQAIQASRMKQSFKEGRMEKGMGRDQAHIQVVIRNALTAPLFDIFIAGYWKRIKKKGYTIAIASWIIMDTNREVAKKSQRVEALDICHTEMQTALLAIQHAISLHIRCANVHTNCSGIVEAIRCFPSCRFELITLCGDLKRVADNMEGCVIRKCSKEQVKRVRDLAVDFSRCC